MSSFLQNKLEIHKRIRENKDFRNVKMTSKDTKILEFNQYQKSDKAPFIIYANLEQLREKIDGCKNDPKAHPQEKYSNIFYQVSQRVQYLHLETEKSSIMYTEVNIVCKRFVNPSEGTQ